MALRKFFDEALEKISSSILDTITIKLAKVKAQDTDVLAIIFPNESNMQEFIKKFSPFELNFIQISNPQKNVLYIAAKIIDGYLVAEFSNEGAIHAFLTWCTSNTMLLAQLSATQIKFSSLALTTDGTTVTCKLNYATPVATAPKHQESKRHYAISLPNHCESIEIALCNVSIPLDIFKSIVLQSQQPFLVLGILAQINKNYYRFAMSAFKILLDDPIMKIDLEKIFSDPGRLPLLSQQKKIYTEIFARTRPLQVVKTFTQEGKKKYDVISNMAMNAMRSHNFNAPCIVQSNQSNQFSVIPAGQEFTILNNKACYSEQSQTKEKANMGIVFFSPTKYTGFSIERLLQHYQQEDRFLLSLELLQIDPYWVSNESEYNRVHSLFSNYFSGKGVDYYVFLSSPEVHFGNPFAAEYWLRIDKFMFTRPTLNKPQIIKDTDEISFTVIAQRVSLLLGPERSKETDAFPLVKMSNSQLQLYFKAELFPRDLAYALKTDFFMSQDALVFKAVDLCFNTLSDDTSQTIQQFVTTASITISGNDAMSTFLLLCTFSQAAIDAFIKKQLTQGSAVTIADTGNAVTTTITAETAAETITPPFSGMGL